MFRSKHNEVKPSVTLLTGLKSAVDEKLTIE